MSASLLSVKNVSSRPESSYETVVSGLDLELFEGELAVFLLESNALKTPLPDLFQGLVIPAKGTVMYKGTDWQRMSRRDLHLGRLEIARLHHGDFWVRSLSVDENITLQHDSCRLDHEESSDLEIIELCRAFGLPGLPTLRPDEYAIQDRRRSALVRAFLMRPSLLILESPERFLSDSEWVHLINLTYALRRRGGSIVCFTQDSNIWVDPALMSTHTYRMRGASVIAE